MMWPQDALVLSATKLKTRKIRLIITVVVSGLLFVVLTTASLVANGVFASVESFSGEGLGKRYILQASPVTPMILANHSMNVNDPTKVAQVKAAFEAIKKEKVAVAKKLKVNYDPASEISPITLDPSTGEEFYDPFGLIPTKLFGDQTVDIELTKRFGASLTQIQQEYEGIGVYRSVAFGQTFGPPTGVSYPTLRVIKDGKESIPSSENQAMNYGNPSGLAGIESSLSAFSDEMVVDLLLPNQNFKSDESSIPLIVPYKASEEILGLSPLQAGTDAEERLDRIKTVRRDIAGKTFQVCIRNQTSIDRQNVAIQQQQDLLLNKDKKTYDKPKLLYDISEQPCQDVVVARDVRSAETKKYDANLAQFEKQFGLVDAAQRIVTFRVVGIAPDPPQFAGFSVTDIVKSILSSYLGTGWYVPMSSAPFLPEYATDLLKPVESVGVVSNSSTYVEVASAQSARNLVKEKSCVLQFSESFDPVASYTKCIEDGQDTMLYPFGSNSLALEETRRGFRKIFPKLLIVVAGISAIVMMGTVGKIIADSRRETAVFRAIGAKRFDIAQIYLTYTMLIAGLIVIVALSLGLLLAAYIQSKYSDATTVEAIVSFNAQNLERKFGFIAFNFRELALLVGVIFLGGLVSAILPLIANLRRNPIRDMRDER